MLLNCGAGADSCEFLGLLGDQSILKEINFEYSLQGLLLKFQYFGHLMEEPTPLPIDAGKKDEMVRPPPQWT